VGPQPVLVRSASGGGGLPERVITRWLAPRGGALNGLTAEERRAARTLASRLAARIVWSSNRDGDHELYLLDLRSQTLRRLTTNPHVDFFARFSPDGRQIVFMRSQRPWVSFRDETAWDVYLINADGAAERVLARGGYAPFWSPDGRAVIFSRGNRVIWVPLATASEEVLLDADQATPGVRVAGANFSPDSRQLAVTVRGAVDGVAVYDLDRRRLVPIMKTKEACQIVWAADGRSAIWIAKGGAGGTRVMRNAAGDPSVFMDLPGRYSHEYFPILSRDGRWLIWGAAAEGHEHDRADYEIFVWEVGTPWEAATRLTYFKGNDQWPDIHVGALP
jgi:dipeptidyl aminopeptidase/acylaminoacyl peptidase